MSLFFAIFVYNTNNMNYGFEEIKSRTKKSC